MAGLDALSCVSQRLYLDDNDALADMGAVAGVGRDPETTTDQGQLVEL